MDTISTRTRAAKARAAPDPASASEASGERDDVPKAQPFAPVEYFFLNQRAQAAARTRHSARLSIRLSRDPQFLLAVAIALPVLAVEGSYQLALPWLVVAVPLAFVALTVRGVRRQLGIEPQRFLAVGPRPLGVAKSQSRQRPQTERGGALWIQRDGPLAVGQRGRCVCANQTCQTKIFIS